MDYTYHRPDECTACVTRLMFAKKQIKLLLKEERRINREIKRVMHFVDLIDDSETATISLSRFNEQLKVVENVLAVYRQIFGHKCHTKTTTL